MNKKLNLLKLTLLLTMFSTVLFAQGLQQTIRGSIKDKDSKESLPGVSVQVLNSTIGVLSDQNGDFKIDKVTVGRVSLKFSMIGYEDQILTELMLGTGKELILNIELTEKYVKTQEVVVTADKNTVNNDMATVSARSFSVEETKRYAASVNDPARAALSYAGVSNNGDFDNGIIIRGNAPRGLLWRMEGVEIPNPNHYGGDGSSGGSISMLSANMLSNSDFYVGAFPAEYGNALSGVFDLKLRNGNDQKREYAFQFGVLGADLALEGPFGKNKSSYLVNYRYSSLAILDGIGIKISGDAVPAFQDLSWKVNIKTKNAGTFTFFGLGGYNQVGETDTAYRFTNEQLLITSGLSHLYLFKNNKTYLKTVFSFSQTVLSDYEENADVPNNYYLIFQKENKERTYRLASTLNHKFSARNTLRVGFIGTSINFNIFNDYYDFTNDVLKRAYQQKGNTTLWQAFVQQKYKFNEKTTLTPGVHVTYFGLNNSASVEPRVGFQYNANGRNTFTAGVGIHSRLEAMRAYFAMVDTGNSIYFQPNKNLSTSKAFHSVMGYQLEITEALRFKVEVYYQHLYNVPVAVDSGSTYSLINYDGGVINKQLLNGGTGDNYGLELTFEHPLKNNFYFLITTSLYNSTYENKEGKTFNTRFNSNYLFNVLIGKEYKVRKNNIVGWNVRTIVAGGLRDTPIDLAASIIADSPKPIESKTYSIQNPLYFRPDVRFNYKINRAKVSHEISLDIQNVINRSNVYSTYYDRGKQKIETAYQLGLIPILNYRIEF